MIKLNKGDRFSMEFEVVDNNPDVVKAKALGDVGTFGLMHINHSRSDAFKNIVRAPVEPKVGQVWMEPFPPNPTERKVLFVDEKTVLYEKSGGYRLTLSPLEFKKGTYLRG